MCLYAIKYHEKVDVIISEGWDYDVLEKKIHE